MDNLKKLSERGVSIWLDDLSRSRITSGDLKNKIDTRQVVGVTTNPSIFAAAIGGDASYRDSFEKLAKAGKTPEEAITEVTTQDVSSALEIFQPVYESSDGYNGRVSIEVSPLLAHDAPATVTQAEQLWEKIRRPNLMVKIPATPAGLEAIVAALSRGISVNVTLIFSLSRYREVINAYLAGLELAHKAGHDLSKIYSVASFFVSRFDTLVDGELEAVGSPEALALRGKCALANTRLAYSIYEESFRTERAKLLLSRGARRQRPLWASTGTKNPAYSKTMYVTELVAPDVVNTMPEDTLQAVYDHGEIKGDTAAHAAAAARKTLDRLAAVGISYSEVVGQLEDEGVKKFAESWENLLQSVSKNFYGGQRS